MKPAPFTYHDPRTLGETLDLLASLENVRLLAGGQSLMPMMNFRYAMPDHVIDLNRVQELAYLSGDPETLRVGAMARQRDLEDSIMLRQYCPLLHAALEHVGHRQTRNRGTYGGSLCHLDPSAELVNVTALLDGTLHVRSKSGRRDIPMSEFVSGFMATSLAPDELLTGATLHFPPKAARQSFVEFARRRGDFAIVACSAVLVFAGNGTIERASLPISGLSHCPIRPVDIERALVGEAPSAVTFKAAAHQAGKLEAVSDAYVTAAYRQHLARVLTFRALDQAAPRAKQAVEVAHA